MIWPAHRLLLVPFSIPTNPKKKKKNPTPHHSFSFMCMYIYIYTKYAGGERDQCIEVVPGVLGKPLEKDGSELPLRVVT